MSGKDRTTNPTTNANSIDVSNRRTIAMTAPLSFYTLMVEHNSVNKSLTASTANGTAASTTGLNPMP